MIEDSGKTLDPYGIITVDNLSSRKSGKILLKLVSSVVVIEMSTLDISSVENL